MTREGLLRMLEDWRLRLAPELQVIASFDEPEGDDAPEDDDWTACVVTRPVVGEALIYFRPKALEQDERDVARLLVHELIHPLLDRVLDHDDALKPYLGAVQWEVFREQRRVAMEEFVNRMAHAIVDGRARVGTIERRPRGA